MPHRCNICDKAYSTASHLARHKVAHQPERRYQCQFCPKSYIRQDIARRHSEKCSNRQDEAVTSLCGRGQPRKACDQCAKAKASCDQNSPCTNCLKSNAQCSYNRLQKDKSVPSTEDPSNRISGAAVKRKKGLTISGISQDATVHARNDYREFADGAKRVPFLLRYTTAAGTGDPSDFASALQTSNEANTTTEVDERPSDSVNFPAISGLIPFFAAELHQYEMLQEPLCQFDLSSQNHHAVDVQTEPLQHRSADLIDIIISEHRETSSSSADTIAMLFSPPNLAICVDSFFQNAYKHIPIIHEASFDIQMAEDALLLSVIAVGAVWSYPRDTYFMVLDVVGMIERCIFDSRLLPLIQKQAKLDSAETSTRILSLLQAATMLMSISLALPDPDHRRRFRDQRFSELIAFVRLVQKGDTVCDTIGKSNSMTSQEWKTWVTRESCNRSIYYTYLLDCHISIMYTTLPRISLLEMKAGLPSDDSMYAAKDALSFHSHFCSSRETPSLSLYHIIKCLMENDPIDPELFKLTVFSLFVAIEAIQTIIFTSKIQFLEEVHTPRLERALARWKQVWDYQQKNTATFGHENNGFMVRAEEVWLLARKILMSDTSKLVLEFGVTDMSQVRQWLTELD